MDTNEFPQGFDRAVEQSLDAIRAKVQWVKREQDGVNTWLKTNGYLRDGKL